MAVLARVLFIRNLSFSLIGNNFNHSFLVDFRPTYKSMYVLLLGSSKLSQKFFQEEDDIYRCNNRQWSYYHPGETLRNVQGSIWGNAVSHLSQIEFWLSSRPNEL